MLKIFLVEDEFVVREGIKNIDWASHGYEFVGEASDGEIAYPMIDKLRPDIVITDIKMPFIGFAHVCFIFGKCFFKFMSKIDIHRFISRSFCITYIACYCLRAKPV